VRAATCRRYVHSTRGSESPTCRPPAVPWRGAPFPRQGPRRTGSPTAYGTMRRSDSLRPSRFAPCWFARRYHPVRLFSSLRSGPTPACGQELCGLAAPTPANSEAESLRVSQGSQATLLHLCPVLRPRRDRTHLAVAVCRRGSRADKNESSPRVMLSGLNRTALVLAVYASPWPLRVPDARRASGGWLDPAGWDWLPTGLLRKVSKRFHLLPLS
jgi:hypothetical protein